MSNSLLKELLEQNIVQRGSFTLKSGETSDIYVDFRRLVSKPVLLKKVCRELWEMMDIVNPTSLKPAIAGVMVGGVPLAMGLSLLYDVPSIIVRDKVKEYGTGKRIEGDIPPDSQDVIVIEDVITTGSSVLETIHILEGEGYKVSKVVVILDRESTGIEKLVSLGYEVKVLFRLSNFKRQFGVVGCRKFTNYIWLEQVLNEVHQRRPISLIVSGGAPGADTLAERWADERGIPKLIFPAEWEKYGKAAGPIRNKDIVANSDVIIAFWDGKSRGTASTIEIAKKAGKPVTVTSI